MQGNILVLKMRQFVLFLCCIFCLAGCGGKEEKTGGVLSDCPISDSKFILFPDSGKNKSINNLPTINHFFKTMLANIPVSKNADISWENPKENFYLFDITVVDVATDVSNSIKLGMVADSPERAVLTDMWVDNQHIPATTDDNYFAILMVLQVPYQNAMKSAAENNTEKLQNDFSGFRLGIYAAEYSGGTACIVLNEGGDGYFEAETQNRIKWEKVNAELMIKIYGEEGSPQFSEVKAQIKSDSSFELDGLVYQLVQSN